MTATGIVVQALRHALEVVAHSAAVDARVLRNDGNSCLSQVVKPDGRYVHPVHQHATPARLHNAEQELYKARLWGNTMVETM